eukprot:2444923-Pyramimonas_sp.AAC.3
MGLWVCSRRCAAMSAGCARASPTRCCSSTSTLATFITPTCPVCRITPLGRHQAGHGASAVSDAHEEVPT